MGKLQKLIREYVKASKRDGAEDEAQEIMEKILDLTFDLNISAIQLSKMLGEEYDRQEDDK